MITARRIPLAATLLGLSVLLAAPASPARAVGPEASEFPPGYEAYHTYAEMVAELDAAVAAYPGLVRKFSIGRSYEGRQIWVAKISDNVARDEDEPEALFDSGIHAREHLAVEMNLYLLRLLTEQYGRDARITALVNSREIYLIFMLNPDGAAYDIAGGEFRSWRKNRQPIPGSSRVGVDLNRNYGFNWGCCDGSSERPRDETYRGWAAWVAPEVRAYRDFVRGRVVGGRQQIRVAISWHASGQLILWPYGYTTDPAPRTMTAQDRQAYAALAQAMAERNGYRAQRSSDLYITDGDQTGWSHYEQRIFHFTFELFPDEVDFYPQPRYIPSQTARNREAVLFLLENADCPYRPAGLAATNCGPLYDDFETARGWRVNAFATDTATGGRWQRGNPRQTRTAAGVKQMATLTSGEKGLVTGLLAGRNANARDVDGGVTSILSPAVRIGGGAGWRASLRYSFAHDARASSADFLRISVVDGSRRHVVLDQRGRPVERNAAWAQASVSLDAYAGRTIRLLIEAADGGSASLVEAAIDDVRVYRATNFATSAPAAPERTINLGSFAL